MTDNKVAPQQSALFPEWFGDITGNDANRLLENLTNTNPYVNRIADGRHRAYNMHGLHDAAGRFFGLVLTPKDADFYIRNFCEQVPKDDMR
jgi:hypothetical protein